MSHHSAYKKTGKDLSQTNTPVLAGELTSVDPHSTKLLSFYYNQYAYCLGDQLARRTFSQELTDLKGSRMTSSSDNSGLTFPV